MTSCEYPPIPVAAEYLAHKPPPPVFAGSHWARE